MARPNKGQHKIPRTYLEAFTDSEGFLWIADGDLKIYKQKPINTLTESDYYTIRFDTGGGTLSVETRFLGGIETTYSKIYRETLKKQLTISNEEKARLSVFVASMMERQPMVRESLKKFLSDAEKHIKHLRGLPDHVKKRAASLPIASGGGPSISADELLKAGKDVGSLHSSLIPDTVVKIAPIIFNMKWAFMVKPKGSVPFITSDNPCVMMDPVGVAKYGMGTFGAAPGLAKKDIELTLPLSSDVALLCGWKMTKDWSYLPVTEKEVKGINARTLLYADSIVCSDKEVLEELVARTKTMESNQ